MVDSNRQQRVPSCAIALFLQPLSNSEEPSHSQIAPRLLTAGWSVLYEAELSMCSHEQDLSPAPTAQGQGGDGMPEFSLEINLPLVV
jgi:hypothetical protein